MRSRNLAASCLLVCGKMKNQCYDTIPPKSEAASLGIHIVFHDYVCQLEKNLPQHSFSDIC